MRQITILKIIVTEVSWNPNQNYKHIYFQIFENDNI